MKFLIPAVILALLAMGGVVIISLQKSPQQTTTTTNSIPSKEEGVMVAGYEGKVLAGKTAPLLDFKKADYDKALTTNKVILLYFYANWCPICRVEAPNELYPAFNELTSDAVIGFRVNYNDSNTDEDEKALAREFAITYQHSKIILKNGKEVLKSLDTWDRNQYLSEIARVLQ